MNIKPEYFKNEETAMYKLRSLYYEYGYQHYKVNKFEEYDFYVRNKTFLVSENILSFTDTNGKLMALKPDVTFSIIKNLKDGDSSMKKVFYNENVYRPSSDSGYFREIPQTGLECIGDIDTYSQCEVIMLAARSLEAISEDYILDVTDVRFISGLLEEAELTDIGFEKAVELIKEKNVSGIKQLCKAENVDEELSDRICRAVSMYGPAEETLRTMEELARNDKSREALSQLEEIFGVMACYGVCDKVKIDLSLIGDMNYYNGIVMNGFISGVPAAVLSGGRYDNLVHKMGKKSGAIGFAVYLDRLERYGEKAKEYDVDVLLLYRDDTPCGKIIEETQKIISGGETVRAGKQDSGDVRYKRLVRI